MLNSNMLNSNILTEMRCNVCVSRWADKLSGQTLKHSMPVFAYTLREPYGVCGLIVPWNFPVALLGMKIGPALAAGNTVVAKVCSLPALTPAPAYKQPSHTYLILCCCLFDFHQISTASLHGLHLHGYATSARLSPM